MRIGRNHSLLLALAIASVAIMVAQPMAIGFASASYSATTVNTGNTISADYFIAGLYESDGVTPADNLITGTFNYATVSGGYAVNATDAGTEGVRIISNTGQHTGAGSYTISGSWTVDSGDDPSYGSTITCYVGNAGTYTDNDSFVMYRSGDSSSSTSVTLSDISSLQLHFDLNLLYASAPTGSVMTISITIVDNTHAMAVSGNNSLTLQSSSAVNVISDANNAEVKPGDKNPSYSSTDEQGRPVTVYLVESERTDGNLGVNISSSDDGDSLVEASGLANNFSASVNIPENTDYAIQITVSSGGWALGTLDLTLRIGNNSYRGTLYNNGTYFAYTPTSGTRLSLVEETSPNHWLNHSGKIILEFSGDAYSLGGNVDIKLQLVFKPTVDTQP